MADVLCNAFFDAMDLDGSGVRLKRARPRQSVRKVSVKMRLVRQNFGKSCKTWTRTTTTKSAERAFWMSKAKDKIQPNGNFAAGYTTYLWDK
jgi:hypothetical protein